MSFADEAGPSNDGVTSASCENKRQRQSLSTLRDGGYDEHHEDDQDNEGEVDRRGGECARRRQHAAAQIRAAHELMFAGTRPDGLRPVTGAPMGNGVSLAKSGGVFVGLAGLSGFDLSFAGAGGYDYPVADVNGPPKRHKRESSEACTPVGQSEGGLQGDAFLARTIPWSEGYSAGSDNGSLPSSGSERGGSPVPVQPTLGGLAQLHKASLLDRAPGSLIFTPGTPACIEGSVSSRNGIGAGRVDEGGPLPRKRMRTTVSCPGVMTTPRWDGSKRSSDVWSGRKAMKILPARDFGTKICPNDRSGSAPQPAILWSALTMNVDELVEAFTTVVGREVKSTPSACIAPVVFAGHHVILEKDKYPVSAHKKATTNRFAK